ncbi:peptidylprolyl isomerase [bacterium]|nr:peptidylprolyl isomerase [bacterium]
MKRFLLAVSILLVSCSQVKLSSNTAGGDPLDAVNTGKDMVLIGKSTIKEGTLEFLAKINPRVGAQLKNPIAKKKLVENLVEQELLYQEAVKRGLDRDNEALTKAALYKKIIISQALVDAEVKKKAKTYYDDKKASEFTTLEAAQITIDWLMPEPTSDNKDQTAANREPSADEKQKTLEKAKQIKARLASGEDFAKVAEEMSDDKATKKKGGNMGDINIEDKRLARRGMEQVGPVAFKMKKDEVSDPIEVKKGYVIIKVLSDQKEIPFEDAEKGIEMQLTKQVKDELVAELTKNNTIVYADTTLKDAPKTEEAVPAPEGVPPAAEAPVAPGAETAPAAPAPAPEAGTTTPPTNPQPAQTQPAVPAEPAAPAPTPAPAPAPTEGAH